MTAETALQPIAIDIVSDVMCPWCFIGKRRLERALPLLDGLAVDIRWRPFQLDPTLPPEGLDRRQYLEAKFGGGERARAIYDNITAAGAAEDIPFDFRAIKVSPNTLDAHCLIRWSANVGAQDAVVEALFSAYFTEGRNIGDHAVLIDIAEKAGMDGDLVAELLARGADHDLVREEIMLAQRLGIDGVPCFIIANAVAIAGAHDPETLARAIREMAERGATTA
ncbi:MAG: DsbA family oxidoreductase [Rhodobiaceae bacterium]|nr:DsbA family oxidoreductase [Rhodobiaceae bacterium]